MRQMLLTLVVALAGCSGGAVGVCTDGRCVIGETCACEQSFPAMEFAKARETCDDLGAAFAPVSDATAWTEGDPCELVDPSGLHSVDCGTRAAFACRRE